MINSELETIRREAKKQMNCEEANEATESAPPDPEASKHPDNEPEVEPPLEAEPSEHEAERKSKLFDEILTVFDKYKDEPISERMKPKTFKLTKENRERLNDANEALTKVIDMYQDITLTDLNALHYSTAVVLAGLYEPTTPCDNTTKFDPDKTTNLKIEKIRKGIGRLTAASKNGIMTKAVKTLLNNKPIDNVLVTYRMQLAAISKFSRTKKSQRNRYQNNKLYRLNQKAFYSKLRHGNSSGITKPPDKEDVKKFWGDLFGNKSKQNENTTWLDDKREKMKD